MPANGINQANCRIAARPGNTAVGPSVWIAAARRGRASVATERPPDGVTAGPAWPERPPEGVTAGPAWPERPPEGITAGPARWDRIKAWAPMMAPKTLAQRPSRTNADPSAASIRLWSSSTVGRG